MHFSFIVEWGATKGVNTMPKKCGGECGNDIPEARLEAMPGVEFCVECQATFDSQDPNQGKIRRSTVAGQVVASKKEFQEVSRTVFEASSETM